MADVVLLTKPASFGSAYIPLVALVGLDELARASHVSS
jgi:hypothetical protein